MHDPMLATPGRMNSRRTLTLLDKEMLTADTVAVAEEAIVADSTEAIVVTEVATTAAMVDEVDEGPKVRLRLTLRPPLPYSLSRVRCHHL